MRAKKPRASSAQGLRCGRGRGKGGEGRGEGKKQRRRVKSMRAKMPSDFQRSGPKVWEGADEEGPREG